MESSLVSDYLLVFMRPLASSIALAFVLSLTSFSNAALGQAVEQANGARLTEDTPLIAKQVESDAEDLSRLKPDRPSPVSPAELEETICLLYTSPSPRD